MRRAAFAVALIALGATPRVAATGAQTGSAAQTPAATVDARPLAGTAASITGTDAPVIAWLQADGGTLRVVARTGREPVDAELGPSEPGADGAPASTTARDGSSWVMATRRRGNDQALWLQGFVEERWEPAIAGPRARRFDHHPALAAGVRGSELWAAWIGEDNGSGSAALYASLWDGSSWGRAETLPRTPGAPMAPALAVTSAGTPVVAWAAGDGGDAEIWVSARDDGSWSTPRLLSNNQVPDIEPSLAVAGDELVVAWLAYTDDGYVPVARRAARIDAWEPPVVVSPTAGSHPRVVALDGRAIVLWRHLEAAAPTGTISARRFDGDAGLGPRVALVSASGSPFAVNGGARLQLAFSQAGGRLGVVGSGDRDGDDLRALAAASAARFGAFAPAAAPTPAPAAEDDEIVPHVPRKYTAFGDSITNGVYYDPERMDGPGYRDTLQLLLQGTFRLGTVFNAGVDGESTVEGVGRIDNAIEAQDPQVILIMEGTNDILAAIDIETIAFNLRQMVQKAYDERPDIIPFLAQLPPRFDPGPDGFDGPGNGRIDELNALLPDIAEDERAFIVDMNTPLDGHPELMSNPVHPSLTGYEVIAQQWYDAIEPVVLEGTNRGDLDGSGRTDGLDLVQLALAFGARSDEERYDPDADINGDGIVNGFDLDLLIELFGESTMPAEGDGS